MLEMQQITKVYRTDFIETYALADLSLTVREGEFIAVMGPSGSGKSTLLNIAGLLDDYDSGTYRLNGEDVRKLGDDERSRYRNQKIGFIFQSFNLIPELNVWDNVEVPLRYRGLRRRQRRELIESALETVGLGRKASFFPTQLSGGQQQRVAVARAIAGSPQLLLADEPTGNLDSLMARRILDLLEEINEQGTTVIMVTHDPDFAARTHRQVHILDGALVELEPMQSEPLRLGGARPRIQG